MAHLTRCSQVVELDSVDGGKNKREEDGSVFCAGDNDADFKGDDERHWNLLVRVYLRMVSALLYRKDSIAPGRSCATRVMSWLNLGSDEYWKRKIYNCLLIAIPVEYVATISRAVEGVCRAVAVRSST